MFLRSSTNHPVRIGTVILAAGASVRMGRPKLLLPWGKKTILAHLIGVWRELGASQLGVVVEQGSPVQRQLLDADGIINPQPELGMFSSIQCAARWKGWDAQISHFAIALGDQPQVRSSTLQQVIDLAAANPDSICQPARNSRPRHPIFLPKAFFLELATATEPNLKQFLQARDAQRKLCELDDPGLDVDLDTPEDYAKALLTQRRRGAKTQSQ